MLNIFFISLISMLSISSFNYCDCNEHIESSNSNIQLSDSLVSRGAVDADTPYGVTSGEYTSLVTGAVATCYAKVPFTYSTSTFYSGWRQWYIDYSSGNYSFNSTTSYGYEGDKLKNVSDFESSVITQYNSFTGDSFFIVTHAVSISGKTGIIIRMFAPYNSRVNNVEVVFKSKVGNLSTGIVYGMGDFSSVQEVSFDDNPVILLRNEYGISNNVGNPDLTANVKHKFVEFYLSTYWVNTDVVGSIDLDLYLLSSFDNNYEVGYNEGYSSGYNIGYDSGESSGYGSGYDVGYTEGENSGYLSGYTAGYDDGSVTDTTASTIFTGILNVALIPVNVFLTIFNFEVFGINISGIVSALLTVSVVVIVIRFILGGKKDD